MQEGESKLRGKKLSVAAWLILSALMFFSFILLMIDNMDNTVKLQCYLKKYCDMNLWNNQANQMTGQFLGEILLSQIMCHIFDVLNIMAKIVSF